MTILHNLEILLNRIVNGDVADRNEMLYFMAQTFIGTDASPADDAPDLLGCVDSVEEIYHKLNGHYITGQPKTLSTKVLYDRLRNSTEWERVLEPIPGAIIISPTGHSTKDARYGHVGICGRDGIVMSNNSFPPNKGIFLENFTVASWKKYYRDILGFPVYFFVQK